MKYPERSWVLRGRQSLPGGPGLRCVDLRPVRHPHIVLPRPDLAELTLRVRTQTCVFASMRNCPIGTSEFLGF